MSKLNLLQEQIKELKKQNKLLQRKLNSKPELDEDFEDKASSLRLNFLKILSGTRL